MEEKQIWATGRRGSAVLINIAIYPHSIVASTEDSHITPVQMNKALKREFPGHIFYGRRERGYLYAQADRL